MTVSYTLEVSNANLCGFAKLLLRWKGSVYKLMSKEMLIFVMLYYTLSMVYRYGLSSEGRLIFEKTSLYCSEFTNLIPLSFVLGFYVAIVVNRWWEQVQSVPLSDKLAFLAASYVQGSDERARIIRRSMIRYANMSIVLTFQLISTAVKKRFPTIDHIQETGLMTKEERRVYDSINCPTGKWWLPLAWTCSLITRAKKEGKIKNDIALDSMIQEVYEIRSKCGNLFQYDWISIPLVYTQVVTLAIYTFFLSTLMGRQYLDPKKGYPNNDVDLYIPVFTLLQFFFYMGWLKVAEQLINPFGEDDDDFESNYIIDRIVQVPFLIVDQMYMKHPKIVKDKFWDDEEPQLPYTKCSLNNRIAPFLGSTAQLDIDPEQEFIPLDSILEEDSDENSYNQSEMIREKNNSNGKYFVEIRDSKILNHILGQAKPEQPPSYSASYEAKKESESKNYFNPTNKVETSLLHRSPSISSSQSKRSRLTRSIAGSISGLRNKAANMEIRTNRFSVDKSNVSIGIPVRDIESKSANQSIAPSPSALAPTTSLDYRSFHPFLTNEIAQSNENIASSEFSLEAMRSKTDSRQSISTQVFEMEPLDEMFEPPISGDDKGENLNPRYEPEVKSRSTTTLTSTESNSRHSSDLEQDTITSVIELMKKDELHRKRHKDGKEKS